MAAAATRAAHGEADSSKWVWVFTVRGCSSIAGCAGTGKDIGDRHPKVRDNVLIGANATILGNITIGKGAQVAAGSLVLKDVPPRTMVAGSPAKEVGRVTGEKAYTAQSLQWVLLHHYFSISLGRARA